MSAVAVAIGLLVGGSILAPSLGPRRPRRVAGLVARVERGTGWASGRHLVLVAVVVAVLCWAIHPLLATVVVGGVSVGRPAVGRRAARRHEVEVRRLLPDVVDLLRSAVDAGLTVGAAVDAVADRAQGAWHEAFRGVQRQVALGERRSVALRELDRLGDVARPLTRALVASERDGAPLTLALDVLARDARLERRRDAEEQARRLPVQLLFPLVLCILPAFGLLTVVPLLAGTFQSLTG